MSEQLEVGTPVAGENVQPVNTETEDPGMHQEQTSENVATPQVEQREGKLYVDGVRVYTRDDTNRIAANAKRDTENKLLGELGVDNFDQVRQVVNSLQDSEHHSLNVDSLRDAVRKREATVEELRAELAEVKTEMLLRDHIGKLHSSMPAQWNDDQRGAVIDLMKSRNMLHLDGDVFAIRAGEDFLTVDGDTPDYAAAVNLMGKTLGLPMAKTGVATYDSDVKPTEAKRNVAVSEEQLRSDPAYRTAYVQIRERNKNLSRSQITDAMVRKQMEGKSYATGQQRMLSPGANSPTPSPKTKTRRR